MMTFKTRKPYYNQPDPLPLDHPVDPFDPDMFVTPEQKTLRAENLRRIAEQGDT